MGEIQKKNGPFRAFEILHTVLHDYWLRCHFEFVRAMSGKHNVNKRPSIHLVNEVYGAEVERKKCG